ncbi:IQ and ubiquitin-like domain-containing protein isoform X2 [Poeciliopsis prolifica]|uniref:IQ and ubiquitin-like domain-containing protein isoform X2 n=1 Tax=Poeciliopsis prolifica TaxID=188132 RepID=UPI00241434A7|nr:IQ and ubiquitin-like domain-containing protein isoform X2 [Poeciliopsis prolifica]
MSKPGETREEGENEKTRESPQTVRSTTTQPPGGGREEKSEDGSDEPSATVLDAVKDQMPDDADEQDKEMNVKNSTATGRVVEEKQSLMELGIRPHSSTQMEMSSSDPTSYPLRLPLPPEHDTMPDVITVQVQKDEGVFKEVVVEIERSHQKKPFLGGYRHRLTGAEYHNATVQTLPKKRPDRGVLVHSLGTQTAELKSKLQQCSVDMSTQMTGIGCYVSCVNDKLVTPGKYVTADEYHGRRLKAVICLQSYIRRWLAQEEVEQLRRERARRLAWFDLQERKCKEEKEAQLRERRRRWMNPQNKEDFNLLYHALQKWRNEEEEQINCSLRGAERKAALCALLEQEMEFIAAIGRHQINVEAINQDKLIRNFLNKAAAAHQWRSATGRLFEMDSVPDIRARALKEIYDDISKFPVDQQERWSFLEKLRNTVMEHECQLVWDIIDLIDREMDLMGRDVKEHNLEGLRKRICTLFLQYIRTPAFNPKVIKLLKVHKKPSELQHDMFFCHGCQRYLWSADFGSSTTGCRSRRCRNCTSLDNVARSRDDNSVYQSILRRLRTDELRLNPETSIPFLLQVDDIRYLIEKVWASCSALNGSRDIYNLAFARWDIQEDWSPWNCILLSKEETSAHTQVEHIQKAYETTFIQWIEQKHSMARQHFSKNPVIAKNLGL